MKPPQIRYVLSIDGGGIRGYMSAKILHHLQRALPRSVDTYFDLTVGTSTGGILALGLRAGMTTEKLLQLYAGDGARAIFARPGTFWEIAFWQVLGLTAATALFWMFSRPSWPTLEASSQAASIAACVSWGAAAFAKGNWKQKGFWALWGFGMAVPPLILAPAFTDHFAMKVLFCAIYGLVTGLWRSPHDERWWRKPRCDAVVAGTAMAVVQGVIRFAPPIKDAFYSCLRTRLDFLPAKRPSLLSVWLPDWAVLLFCFLFGLVMDSDMATFLPTNFRGLIYWLGSSLYSRDLLDEVLRGELGEETFEQLADPEDYRPAIVTTYNADTGAEIISEQYHLDRGDKRPWSLAEGAAATSAAPLFFPGFQRRMPQPPPPAAEAPWYIPTVIWNYFHWYIANLRKNVIGPVYYDGGLVANNPTLIAYAEARRRWPRDEIRIVCVGTGVVGRAPLPRVAGIWDVTALLTVPFETSSLQRVVERLIPADCITVLQPHLDADIRLDDVSNESRMTMNSTFDAWLKQGNDAELVTLAEKLRAQPAKKLTRYERKMRKRN